MHSTKRSTEIPKHLPDFITSDATRSTVSGIENHEGPAISSFCFAVKIEENTGHLVRSQDPDCKAMEDDQFDQRVPNNRDMSYVSQLNSGTNTQQVNKDDDNNNTDNNGDVLYFNQHPNEWMSKTTNMEISNSGSTRSEYGGMAIEDDNYKIVNKVILAETPSSASSSSLNQPKTSSTDLTKSSDKVKSTKLTMNEKAKLIHEFYSPYDEIHVDSDTANEQESLYDSSVYNIDSNHNFDAHVDFSVLCEYPLQNSKTEPNFLSIPDRIGTLDSFEATQSENKINHMSNLDPELDKPDSEKSMAISASKNSTKMKNSDPNSQDDSKESVASSFKETSKVQSEPNTEVSTRLKTLNNQYLKNDSKGDVVQDTSSTPDDQSSIEETEFFLDEENDENE